MSVDERSPKRQRRSYSPDSPPETKPVFVAQHPHTPPPSVHSQSMSPAWQAQSSSSQQGATFPTPPSISGYHSQMTGKTSNSEEGVDSVTGTPMNSTEHTAKDGDGDVDMGGSEPDAAYRRTDHERRAVASTSAESSGPV